MKKLESQLSKDYLDKITKLYDRRDEHIIPEGDIDLTLEGIRAYPMWDDERFSMLEKAIDSTRVIIAVECDHTIRIGIVTRSVRVGAVDEKIRG